MATGTIATVVSIGGVSINQTVTKTADHANVYGDGGSGITLAAAKGPLTSWVKTDADTAAGDIPTGHGYSTGKMDVFWVESSVAKCRYDVDGTVTGDGLALDGGSGDDFPANGQADVMICTPQQINTAIDGDAAKMFSFLASVKASIYFEDTAGAEVAQFDLVADTPRTWHEDSDESNPLTGNPVTVCYATNGTAAAGYLTIQSLEDSTP